MQAALKLTTTVQPGGRVEIHDAQLTDGASVDVIVLLPRDAEPSGRSIVDVLAEAPGQIAFRTADEVEAYLREERDSWKR